MSGNAINIWKKSLDMAQEHADNTPATLSVLDHDFVLAVVGMRLAQQTYFAIKPVDVPTKELKSRALILSKQIEKIIDSAIKNDVV